MTRKKSIQYERIEQNALMAWARWQKWHNGKVSHYLHHSPNGGSRNAIEANNLKMMGVMKGFPDLFLFIAKHGYHGLFIELKRKEKHLAKIDPEQTEVLDRLSEQGYLCQVCFGANEAIDVIKQYLEI